MPLTLEIRPARGRREGSAGTAANTGTFPAFRGASTTESTAIPVSDGSDIAGGSVPSAGGAPPVIDGEPEGDDLRALRTGALEETEAAGSMLGDTLLGGPARCASEGLGQRMTSPSLTWGAPLAEGALKLRSLRIAATLSTGLSMGAFLSQCICQLGGFLGVIDRSIQEAPLATADAAAAMNAGPGPPQELHGVGAPPLAQPEPDASAFPPGGGETSDLVIACQTALLAGYCTLVQRGILPCGLDMRQVAMDTGEPLCHPVQDPTGALTAALLIVRRNRSNLRAGNPVSLTAGGLLGVGTRRVLGAILCVTHKMTAHAANVSYRTYAQHCVDVMQSPLDVPTHEYDWIREMDAMVLAERAVLAEPLFKLTTENPIGELEHIIDRLQRSSNLDSEDALLIRGMAFFFYGSLLFQDNVAAVDAFVARAGMRTVAAGCAIGSFACFAAACLKDAGSCKPSVVHATAVANDGGKPARHAAAAVLAAAVSPAASALRWGPYEEYSFEQGTTHPVQLLLHPRNLARARAMALYNGWAAE